MEEAEVKCGVVCDWMITDEELCRMAEQYEREYGNYDSQNQLLPFW